MSAFVTANSEYKPSKDTRLPKLIVDSLDVKFMLLHDQKSEDSIRNFFNDVYELYIKVNGNEDDG